MYTRINVYPHVEDRDVYTQHVHIVPAYLPDNPVCMASLQHRHPVELFGEVRLLTYLLTYNNKHYLHNTTPASSGNLFSEKCDDASWPEEAWRRSLHWINVLFQSFHGFILVFTV